MSQRISTRQRLVHAALELFTSQGITETTTRQIAEFADVNEVTLFRQFGNKHGLLLAVIESAAFSQLGESLSQQLKHTSSVDQALKNYAKACLQALEQIPEFIRSVVGEAGHYPVENRQALGQGLTAANRTVAQYLATVIHPQQLSPSLSVEKLASLLNGLLLGHALIELTSEFHGLWQSQDDFIENLVNLFLEGAILQPAAASSVIATDTPTEEVAAERIDDLPANLVRLILQRAKKLGLRDYGLAYVLFAAGLSPAEIATLKRSHHICDAHQHLLQVSQGLVRQVPVNQWIIDRRYGSYTRNPLTQWLKSRKDDQPALFLNNLGKPISETEIRMRWQVWAEGMSTLDSQPTVIEQAQQTWCVEMLIRGIGLEDLSLLTGWDLSKLQPYVRRAKEKAALKKATALDRSPSVSTENSALENL